MSTDHEWVRWGQQDPYFAVITDAKFRSAKLTEAARQEFFDSGRYHVQYVMDACRRLAGPAFVPARALDFGCGVGRVALPLAQKVQTVVGVDVSPAMLAEARNNCEQQGIRNVELRLSDDDLSAVQGPYDLVHSCITFQHIDVQRGRHFFKRLVDLLAEGGVGAIQITYAKAYHASTFGQPPPPAPAQARKIRIDPRSPDPEMQMNPYSLSELAFLLQAAGVQSFQADFTDHGGELGVFLFFSKPRAPGA
jgi:SAM-dependent methyltransferase